MISDDAGEGSFWYTASLRSDGTAGWPIQFFAGTETTPVARTSVDGFVKSDLDWNWNFAIPSLRKPVHYSLPEKTLAAVGRWPSRIVVKRFDARAAFKDSGFEILTVVSTPPAVFPKQPNLTYRMETLSTRGGVTYRLESGPADMTVSPEGLVAWKGPTDDLSFRRAAMVAVSDGSGRTTRHAFHVPSSSFEALQTAVATTVTPAATPQAAANGTAGAATNVPAVAADYVVQLPDAPAAVEGAGDGRYLLLAFPQLRRVGVFDLQTPAAMRLVDVGSTNFLIAGGLTRFVVVDREKKRLVRYGVASGALELETPQGASLAGVTGAAMGARSEGPVLLWFGGDPASGDSLRCAELETLNVRSVPVANRKTADLFEKGDEVKKAYRLTASADGRRIVIAHRGGKSNDRDRWSMFAYRDGQAAFLEWRFGDRSSHAAYEGGTVFDYTERDSLCDTVVRFEGKFFPVRSCFADETWLSYGASNQGAGSGGVVAAKPNSTLPVRIHKGLNGNVLANIALDVGSEPLPAPRLAEVSHYFENQKMLAIVQTNPDRISLFRIDADALIAAAKTPYLAFNSSPPLLYATGGKLTYQMRAVSDSPVVRFRLVSGPAGMTVSPEGLMEWKAPSAAEVAKKKGPDREQVVVVANSAVGEMRQSFWIRNDAAASILYGPETKAPSAAPGGTARLPNKP
jgi:hypothetical protein